MFITFFKEFTKQSNTAFSLGTRLIVFKGLRTRSTRRDLIVDKLWPAELCLQKKKHKISTKNRESYTKYL